MNTNSRRRRRRTTTTNVVHPGDLIEGGFRHDEQPEWWHDIKNGMDNQHLLRKCEFLDHYPNTGDDCPGVATHSDHYFCIFGDEQKPSWFCTCYEHVGDYKFHCNSNQISTVEEITQDLVSNNKEAVRPGDYIDEDGGYQHTEHPWWYDIKTNMQNEHLLRKCDFLKRIPNTGDRCPGVATRSDHYFCIFGTSVQPSWYCTCYEHVSDYTFHCNSNQISTVEEIMIQIKDQPIASSSENDNIFQEEEEHEKENTDAIIVDAIQHIVLFEENTATNDNDNNKDETVRPGDLIDKAGGYQHEESEWWHDIKNDMANQHLLRKCDFLERIPKTGDSCPGVATHSDHYFCIFGTSVRPSWYCTCYEHVGDYTFYCNSNTIITVDEISDYSNNNENDNSKYILDDLPSEQQLPPPEQNNSVEEISAALTKSTRDGNKNDENLTKTMAVDDSSASGSEKQQEQQEEEKEEEEENKGEIREKNNIIITEGEDDAKELGVAIDDSSASGSAQQQQQQQQEENKGGIRKSNKSIATKVEDDAKELGFSVATGIGLFIGIVIISNVIFVIAQ